MTGDLHHLYTPSGRVKARPNEYVIDLPSSITGGPPIAEEEEEEEAIAPLFPISRLSSHYYKKII